MIIHTHKRARTIKKTLIAMGILLVLALVAGAIDVYLADRHATIPEPTLVPAEKKPLADPPASNPDAPTSASVQYITTPVKPGENSTITILTNPRAVCGIVVAYNNVVSKDSGLITKTADVHGSVSWAWTVDSTAALGKWPIKVTCKINNKTGYVEGYQTVEK